MDPVKTQIEIPDARYFERLIACREACPVRTDARGYVQAVASGDYALAYRIARAPNPFASICGRVCGAPCERACRRGAIDKPVSIRAIKRTATERHGVETPVDPIETLRHSTAPGSLNPEPLQHRVAIIGAGVAGMTCAHDLARLGVQVTVFESGPEAGGMLRTGVPVYRLPRGLWRKEIEAILHLGVELRCGTTVGRDITIDELHAQGFEYIVIAVGLQKSRALNLPGNDLDGVTGGFEFLEKFNEQQRGRALGRTVVIGGGNVAYDCARSARRMPGTTSVTLVCLEALHEMPADEIEIIEGKEENIALINRRGPVRFVGENGVITGLETRAVSRVFDEAGRFAPELTPGTEEVIACDHIVVAVGQQSDPGFANGVSSLEFGRSGSLLADRNSGATSVPWLYAIGDIALGPGLFIDAIAHGQRAARGISRRLGIEEAHRDSGKRTGGLGFVEEAVRQGLRHDYLRLPRRLPPCSDENSRWSSPDAQVELTFPDKTAREQGARCLRCEVETIFDGTKCILCGGCADVCPTWCLKLVTTEEIGLGADFPGMSAIIKDEDRCIRCGYCAERCPTDAITMESLCNFEPWTQEPEVRLLERKPQQ